MGVAATYVFWRYLHKPTWRRAAAAGVLLGVAQLTKFSMLLLYAVWPFLWLVQLVIVGRRRAEDRSASTLRSSRGAWSTAWRSCVELPHDRRRLLLRGRRHPARPVRVRLADPHAAGPARDDAAAQPEPAPRSAWQFRVNRFRGTWLGRLPCRCPSIISWASTSRRSRPRASRAVLRGRPDTATRR